MEKNNLEKLENLMWKEYKKQISFQQVQKEFLKNDDERIEYIKTELEKAYNEKNGHSVDIFDYDSELKIGSVKEQEEFFESWIESF